MILITLEFHVSYFDDDTFNLSTIKIESSDVETFDSSPKIEIAQESILIHVNVQISSEWILVFSYHILNLLSPLVSLRKMSKSEQFKEERFVKIDYLLFDLT